MPDDPKKTLTAFLDGADLEAAKAAAELNPPTPDETPPAQSQTPQRRKQPITSPTVTPPAPVDEPDLLAMGMDEGETTSVNDPDTRHDTSDAPSPSPDKPKHSPRALQLAEHYQLSSDWVESATPEQLAQEIELARLEEDAAERFEQKRLAQEKARREAEEAAQKTASAEDELDLGEMDDEDEYGKPTRRKVTEKDISPAVLRVLKAQQKEIVENKKFRQAQEAKEAARATEKINAALDNGFARLGDAYKEIFGEGEGTALDPKSQELADRVTIIRAANILDTDTPAQITKKIVETAKRVYGRFIDADETPTKETPASPQKPVARAPKKPDPLEERKKLWAGAGVSTPAKATRGKNGHLRELLNSKDLPDTDNDDDTLDLFDSK